MNTGRGTVGSRIPPVTDIVRVVRQVVEQYAELVRRVLAAPPRLGPVRLVAVDGPSGSGKSVFAARLATAFVSATDLEPPVVHTDDLLNGWRDQFTFWSRLEQQVLAPLRAGRPGGYQRYNWVRRRFVGDQVPVPPAPVVIMEGLSTSRATIRPELSLAVFVTAPARLRLSRTLARDGAGVEPELRRWRRGERAYFAAEAPRWHADLVIDGATELLPNGREDRVHDDPWYLRLSE